MNLMREHVEAACRELPRLAHALEGGRPMQLDLTRLALRRERRVHIAIHVVTNGRAALFAAASRRSLNRNVCRRNSDASASGYSAIRSATAMPSHESAQRYAS